MTTSNTKANLPSLAAFITPHGFGHAARASAVMIQLQRLLPQMDFHLFTTVPEWFYRESNLTNFQYHPVITDLGLVQRSAMEEDLPATIRRLEGFLPFSPDLVSSLAAQVNALNCQLVLCDIAPLGIAVAQLAGIPSLLEENFTWDWIYAGYPSYQQLLQPYIDYLAETFSKATYHIQTAPVSQPDLQWEAVQPVSRPIRQPRATIRSSLGIDAETPVVLVSMGGIESRPGNLAAMRNARDFDFILPDASAQVTRDANLLLLPHHHGIYHPDLVNACDAVVGKLGYSTLAECYAADAFYGYIAREHFPESPSLGRFIETSMRGTFIQPDEYASGAWIDKIRAPLAQPHKNGSRANGADQIACLIKDLLA